MEKIDVQTMQYLLREMEKTQKAHPKARVYYSTSGNEIRVTYPLPVDFKEGYITGIQP